MHLFYHNLTFPDDSLYMISQVNRINIAIDEKIRSKLLEVPKEKIKSLKKKERKINQVFDSL